MPVDLSRVDQPEPDPDCDLAKELVGEDGECGCWRNLPPTSDAELDAMIVDRG